MRTLAALALVAALSGCSGKPDAAPASGAAERLSGPCPVTPPGAEVREDFNYGDRSLAAALWPKGRLIAGPLPDGSSYATIGPGGSIVAKLGWWRGVDGVLRIEGERLDSAVPPLRADIPAGYGPTGFQATALTFPTEGCWSVVGRAGRARLTFVVLVSKRR